MKVAQHVVIWDGFTDGTYVLTESGRNDSNLTTL